MADYRKCCLELIALDGKIDEGEVKILKKHLYADGKISSEEFAFLVELRQAVSKKVKDPQPAFDKFFLKALMDKILDNKIISADEADLVKKHVIGKIDDAEVKKFLAKIDKEATQKDEKFVKLYEAYKKEKEKAAEAK